MSCIKSLTFAEFSKLVKQIVSDGVIIYRGVDTSNDLDENGVRLMNSFVDEVDKDWFMNTVQMICIISSPEEFFTTRKEAEDYIEKKVT